MTLNSKHRTDKTKETLEDETLKYLWNTDLHKPVWRK